MPAARLRLKAQGCTCAKGTDGLLQPSGKETLTPLLLPVPLSPHLVSCRSAIGGYTAGHGCPRAARCCTAPGLGPPPPSLRATAPRPCHLSATSIPAGHCTPTLLPPSLPTTASWSRPHGLQHSAHGYAFISAYYKVFTIVHSFPSKLIHLKTSVFKPNSCHRGNVTIY